MLWVGAKRNVLNDNFVTVEEGNWPRKTSPCGIPVPNHNAVDAGVDPTRGSCEVVVGNGLVPFRLGGSRKGSSPFPTKDLGTAVDPTGMDK